MSITRRSLESIMATQNIAQVRPWLDEAQNIDELHQIAGNSPERVIEVHGTMRKFMCFGCGMRGPMQLVLERVRAGEDDPPCRGCGGILQNDTISFGQQLVPEILDKAMQAAGEADLF